MAEKVILAQGDTGEQMCRTEAEAKINKRAHELDNVAEELKKLLAKCKHRFVGTWDGFDRCEICGQPGEPDR